MHDVAVERGEMLVASSVVSAAVREIEQIGAHGDQIGGAAGRTVQSPDQFLPPRLGGKVEGTAIAIAGLGHPGFDGLVHLVPVWSEIARQRMEEGTPLRIIEIVITIENLAGH